MFTMCQALSDSECQNMSSCPYKDPKGGKASGNLVCVTVPTTFPWWLRGWVSGLPLASCNATTALTSLSYRGKSMQLSSLLNSINARPHVLLTFEHQHLEYHWKHSGYSVNTSNAFFHFFFLFLTVLKYSQGFNSCSTMKGWYKTAATMGGYLHHKARYAGSEKLEQGRRARQPPWLALVRSWPPPHPLSTERAMVAHAVSAFTPHCYFFSLSLSFYFFWLSLPPTLHSALCSTQFYNPSTQ